MSHQVDPRAYRRRLIVSFAILLPFVLAVFGWHAWDAHRRGEAPWPVLLGVVLSGAVIGGTVYYLTRGGPSHVKERTARLMKWVAPIAVAIAALRAILWLAGWW